MKDKKLNFGLATVIDLFRKLYDQQFPDLKSCFELIEIESEIEKLKKSNNDYKNKTLKICYLFFVIILFNFIFLHHNLWWYKVLTLGTLVYGTFIFLSSTIRFFKYSRTITELERELDQGGFKLYKDLKNTFAELSNRCGWSVIVSKKGSQTVEKLVECIEYKTRLLVYIIKSNQATPDYYSLKTIDFFEDEKVLLKKLVEFICKMGLMGTSENVVLDEKSNRGIIDKRAHRLYKKLFEEVAI